LDRPGGVAAQVYVPRKGVREARGIALIRRGSIQVKAPDDYIGPPLTDPSSPVGYTHCFLKPYQALTHGFLTKTRDVQPDVSLRSVVYVLLEERKPNGLVCAGSVSLSGAKSGFTFCFFPAMPRVDYSKREVAYLTAHIRFEDGRLIADKLHAKVRLESESIPSRTIRLKRVRLDDHHFAFEYWAKDIDYLHPAGPVRSPSKSPYTGTRWEKTIRKIISRTQPFTFGCSLPSDDGRGRAGLSVFARVGVVMDKRVTELGGVDRVLSQPHGATKPSPARIHRHLDPSRLRPEWPSDASVFVEAGVLTAMPMRDYGLPDVSEKDLAELSE